MLTVEKCAKNDRDALYFFLAKVNYHTFDFWPNVNKDKVLNFLTNNIIDNNNTEIFSVSENGKIMALLVYELLPWDSKYFGFICGKIDYIFIDNNLDINLQIKSLKTLLNSFKKYVVENKIKFIQASISSWEHIICHVFQTYNFNYILTWLDGIYPSQEKVITLPENETIGLVEEKDLEQLIKISSESYFNGGRFYFDNNFNKFNINQIYENLVINSFNKDIMFVYRINEIPIGLFISKKIITYKEFNNLNIAPLRFLIIDPKYRGRNIAFNLFCEFLNYLSRQCDLITTGLEVHNIASLNLHAKLGFRFNYTHNVFHYWAT